MRRVRSPRSHLSARYSPAATSSRATHTGSAARCPTRLRTNSAGPVPTTRGNSSNSTPSYLRAPPRSSAKPPPRWSGRLTRRTTPPSASRTISSARRRTPPTSGVRAATSPTSSCYRWTPATAPTSRRRWSRCCVQRVFPPGWRPATRPARPSARTSTSSADSTRTSGSRCTSPTTAGCGSTRLRPIPARTVKQPPSTRTPARAAVVALTAAVVATAATAGRRSPHQPPR